MAEFIEDSNRFEFSAKETMRVTWVGVAPIKDPVMAEALGALNADPIYGIVVEHVEADGSLCGEHVLAVPLQIMAQLYAQIMHMVVRLNDDETTRFADWMYETEKEIQQVERLHGEQS